MSDSPSPSHLHPDLVCLGPGHYRMGRVHFEHRGVAKEPCAACNGRGTDPANHRHECLPCCGTGRVRPAENEALKEGYHPFRCRGNATTLDDAVRMVTEDPFGFDHHAEAASYVYYLEEES